MRSIKKLESIFRAWYFDLQKKPELPDPELALFDLIQSLSKHGFIIVDKPKDTESRDN